MAKVWRVMGQTLHEMLIMIASHFVWITTLQSGRQREDEVCEIRLDFEIYASNFTLLVVFKYIIVSKMKISVCFLRLLSMMYWNGYSFKGWDSLRFSFCSRNMTLFCYILEDGFFHRIYFVWIFVWEVLDIQPKFTGFTPPLLRRSESYERRRHSSLSPHSHSGNQISNAVQLNGIESSPTGKQIPITSSEILNQWEFLYYRFFPFFFCD